MHNPRSLPPRPRAPVALIAVAAILALLLIGAVLFGVAYALRLLDERYPFFSDVILLAISLGIGAFVVAVLALLALGMYNRWAGRPSVFADKTVALTLAQRSQGLPAHIQSLSYSDSHKALPLPAPEMEIAAQIAPPMSVPPFRDLLDQGRIGSGKPLILAYNAITGQPIIGSWEDLYSCGIGAQMGAGKSWLMAFLLAQSVAAGGRLIICDLHAGDEESLANRIVGLASAFMCDVATTPKEIEIALKLAADKLEARRTNAARWPIIVACDEWTSLLRTSAGPALPKYLQDIAEQGRKYNVNGILAAQAWTKDASSAVRNQLTSHYVLRQRPDEARYQLGLRADQLPDDVRSLPDATGYFLNVRGELTKVVIPRMTSADIARCGELIDRPASALGQPFGFTLPTQPLTPSAVATPKPDRSQIVATQPMATMASQSATAVSPEAARAAGLFVAGKSPAEIVRELRNVNSSEGSRYQQALNEVLDLIRQGVSR